LITNEDQEDENNEEMDLEGQEDGEENEE